MDRSRAHTTEGMNLAPYHMHTLGRFSRLLNRAKFFNLYFYIVFTISLSHEDGETDTASENDDIEESSNQQIMSHQTEHQLVISRPGSVNSVTESGGQQAQHKFRKGEVLTAVSTNENQLFRLFAG